MAAKRSAARKEPPIGAVPQPVGVSPPAAINFAQTIPRKAVSLAGEVPLSVRVLLEISADLH